MSSDKNTVDLWKSLDEMGPQSKYVNATAKISPKFKQSEKNVLTV